MFRETRVVDNPGLDLPMAHDLTWPCLVGVILSWLAISLPALAVWGVLSTVWAK